MGIVETDGPERERRRRGSVEIEQKKNRAEEEATKEEGKKHRGRGAGAGRSRRRKRGWATRAKKGVRAAGGREGERKTLLTRFLFSITAPRIEVVCFAVVRKHDERKRARGMLLCGRGIPFSVSVVARGAGRTEGRRERGFI